MLKDATFAVLWGIASLVQSNKGNRNLDLCKTASMVYIKPTPPESNMEPENTPLEKENNLPSHHFQVLCSSSGVYKVSEFFSPWWENRVDHHLKKVQH